MLTVLFSLISNLNLNMDVFEPTRFPNVLLRWSRDVGVTTLEVTGNISGGVVTPTSVVSLNENSVRHQTLVLLPSSFQAKTAEIDFSFAGHVTWVLPYRK